MEKLEHGIEAKGPIEKRFDRDFRKQKIMTVRTLLLENILIEYMIVLKSILNIDIGMDSFISLFLKRSGVYIETTSKVIYRMNTEGLSLSYKTKLRDIAKAVSAMNIYHKGKPIEVVLNEPYT